VLDAMFEAYTTLVGRLASEPALWDEACTTMLPAAMSQRRADADCSAAPLRPQPLHGAIVAHALEPPGSLAAVATRRALTFGELLSEGANVADWLLSEQIRPGELVAVVTRKGWEQAVAVLGVLLAGGAYVPIDADLPAKRVDELLRLCSARHVLAQP